ncbi:MAG: acyl-CoA thioesterase [Candidatus Adiutrix sp.]|jgi:acyl-CoA thioester hydrolase|nr:acyl-CoA thioesterase [Candidatus Adiutrix sp.]
MFKPYFRDGGGPPPLSVVVERAARLEETDLLGIVWHGRYAGYLEDGREAFGRRYGLSYLEFRAAGAVLPIRILHLEYLAPLKYLEAFAVEATLHYNEAARLDMEYKIVNQKGETVTRGYSVQMMVGLDGVPLLEAPPLYLNFQKRWREGLL